MPLVERAEVPRPFVDLDHCDRESGLEKLPVQEQSSRAPISIEERAQ